MKERSKAESTVQIDNERVRVTERRFPPLRQLLLESEEGDSTADLDAGVSYFRELGVEHYVVNVNSYEFVFIEIEVQSA